MGTTPAAADPADPAAADPADGGARRGRSRRRTGLVVVAGVVLLALSAAVVALVRTPSDAATRDSALLAARTYTQSLTTFDARTLAEDAERVRRASTPEFVEEYDGTLDDGLRESIEATRTVSTGTVVGAGLESLEGGTATVLVAVDQEILGAETGARTEANRLRMRLERREGRWLIAGVERL